MTKLCWRSGGWVNTSHLKFYVKLLLAAGMVSSTDAEINMGTPALTAFGDLEYYEGRSNDGAQYNKIEFHDQSCDPLASDVANGEAANEPFPPDHVNLSVSNTINMKESLEEQELDSINGNIPDLPSILKTDRNGPRYLNPDCARFPDLSSIQHSNTYWQVQNTEMGTYFLYSAYLDVRGRIAGSRDTSDYIRVLGMTDAGSNMTLESSLLKMCQLWFHNQTEPSFAKIVDIKLLWDPLWGHQASYFPYLFTCQPSPHHTKSPFSVSLVNFECAHATNNLKVLHQEKATTILRNSKWSPPHDFGVCVKPLDFPEKKYFPRLAEWIEAMRLTGAHKIHFYKYIVNGDVERMLKYYQSRGFVENIEITLPGVLPNHPLLRGLYLHNPGTSLDKRIIEVVPLNDCLYRNMYNYKYVAPLDTDELIVPMVGQNWREMLTLVNNELDIENYMEPISAYCFRNYYFLDRMLTRKRKDEVADIPADYHMLRHIHRTRFANPNQDNVKCFHSTEVLLGIHNHLPFYCIDNGGKRNATKYNCIHNFIEGNRAKLHHYRNTCAPEIRNCGDYLKAAVKDKTLWHYKNELISNVENAMADMQYLSYFVN